jgi:hypothetical protein
VKAGGKPHGGDTFLGNVVLPSRDFAALCPRIIYSIVTDLINALPGNSSVNTVQHATVDEAVFFYAVRAEHRWYNRVKQPVSKQQLDKRISTYGTVL